MRKRIALSFGILAVFSGTPTRSLGDGLLKNAARLKTTQRERNSGKFYGSADIRPQIDSSDGALSSENTFEAGAKWDWGSVGYSQEVDTHPSNAKESGPFLADSYLVVQRNGIWSRDDNAFNFEYRAYLPAATAKQDRGMITAMRFIFKFTHKLSDSVSFEFREIPIAHIYQDAGVDLPDGPVSNPIFENRLYFITQFKLSSDVTFSLPMYYFAAKYRDYKFNAQINDDWDPNFFLWPEVTVAVSPNVSVGAAYRTNNFLNTTEAGTVAVDGLGNGVFQGVLGLSF